MSLYAGSANKLAASSLDAQAWAEIYWLLGIDVAMVDRAGFVQVPCDIKVYEPFKLPDLSTSPTYQACCDEAAQDLLKLQERLQKPIYLFYSGGIDSTLVLVSLLKVEPKLHDRVVIVLSPESIRENPRFYREHVRKFRLESSLGSLDLLDGSKILVGGEHNDQLFGTDLGEFVNSNLEFSLLHQPFTRELIVKLMTLKLVPEQAAHIWFDVMTYHIKQAPIQVRTVFEFFWWVNFCFKWQPVFFRILARSRRLLTHELVRDYFHHFFSTSNFQRWSMLNPELKLGSSWDTYKQLAKDIIFEFTRDDDYHKFKLKEVSLHKIFKQSYAAIAITDQMKLLDEVDPAAYYVASNSFKTQ